MNTNQQANVAVALAGTRQQSRLIAMMQDFDRTLELVDISANSYGATMAQSTDYMQGLEAAQTRLKNSVEDLVNTLTNTDFIIGIVDGLTSVVKYITENTKLLIPVAVILASTALSILNTKILELQVIREQALIDRQAQLEKMTLISKESIEKQKQLVQEKKSITNEKKAAVLKAKNLLQEKKETLEETKQAILNDASLKTAKQKQDKIQEAERQFNIDKAAAQDAITQAQKEYDDAIQDERAAKLELNQMQQDALAYKEKSLQIQRQENSQMGILGKM